MITPGLVSVTFRHLPPEDIVDLARQAGLEALEWGGDVHVPHGDLARARQVGHMTVEAGLRVCAYGSYYRVGANEAPDFEAVLATALALGAPLIRVWAGPPMGARGAGKWGSRDASPADWERVAVDSRRICDLAAREGLTVAYEFHAGTLTDTNESARRLLEMVNQSPGAPAAARGPALRSLWQPPRRPPYGGAKRGTDRAYNIEGLKMVGPWLANLHVFHWIRDGKPPLVARRPLAEGEADWPIYLRQAAADGVPRCALLEFVRDDRPEQLMEDAAVLKRWLAAL